MSGIIYALVISWLMVGVGTAILTSREAAWAGLRVHLAWWVLFVILGPIVPLLAAIAILLGPDWKRR